MELTSEPAYLEETVTDLDVVYIGDVRQLTLREGDRLVEAPNGDIRVTMAVNNVSEDITFYARHMLYRRLRTRVIRTEMKRGPSVTGVSSRAAGSPADTSSGERL